MSADPAVGQLTAALRWVGCRVPVHQPATTPGSGQPAVILLRQWSIADADALSRRAWRIGARWVPVRLDGGLVLIGPLLRPGARICLGCAERARLRVFGPDVPAGEPALRLSGVAAPVVLPVLAAVAAGMLAAPDRHDGVVVAVRGDHATLTTHRLSTMGNHCPVCTPRPESPAVVRVTFAPTPTARPDAFRGANPLTSGQRLRDELYDFRHGPVARLRRTENTPLALVTAELAGDRPIRDAGHGRSLDFAHAERVALLEAVERRTGMRPHGHRAVVMASFAELGSERAVDPERLGLPEPRYHGHPLSRTVPYRPDVATRWVYGWSLTADRQIAVPEHVAYWGVSPATAPRFVHENSNGCGLGNSLAEAVLYGLFEVAERDAFLMAWYAQTALAEVRIPEQDRLLPHLADRLEEVGYRLHLFDATNDLMIPCILALALREDPHSPAPQAFFAAGAHPDPLAAIRAAAAEVVVDVFSLADHVRRRPGHLDPRRLRAMLADPERVATIDDHVAVHTLTEARPRYEFLLGGPAAVPWWERWPESPAPVADLGQLLADTVRRLAAEGLEVVAVDQTDPAVRERLGLYSAKVIVPGTLPMTFGHVNRRTRGLPRLCEVPHRLGRLPVPPRYDDLALYPHPFP